jgi:hypothetical protein
VPAFFDGDPGRECLGYAKRGEMFAKLYMMIGIGIIALYGLSSLRGWEIGTPKREVVPADVRQSPGGYRSFHFWHSGFHGGK